MMNSERRRRADEEQADSGEDVDRSPETELDPMCSPRHHRDDVDADGRGPPAAEDPDVDGKDGRPEEATKWTTTIGDILENFAEDTSLLGVPRAILASSRLARLFWIIVVVTCMIMFIVGCTEQTVYYFSYPKQVRAPFQLGDTLVLRRKYPDMNYFKFGLEQDYGYCDPDYRQHLMVSSVARVSISNTPLIFTNFV